MSVAVSATGSAQDSSATTVNYNGITVNTGDSSMLAWVTSIGLVGITSAPTWAGVPMTLLRTQTTPDNASFRAHFYGIGSPIPGNNILSFGNGAAGAWSVCAQSYVGSAFNVTDAFPLCAIKNGSSGAANVTNTATTNDLIAGCFAALTNPITTDFTSVFNDATINTQAGSIAPGAGSVTLHGTLGANTQWLAMAQPILAPVNLLGGFPTNWIRRGPGNIWQSI